MKKTTLKKVYQWDARWPSIKMLVSPVKPSPCPGNPGMVSTSHAITNKFKKRMIRQCSNWQMLNEDSTIVM